MTSVAQSRLVLVRGFAEKAYVREILSEDAGSVVVCRPDHADAIRRGELPEPVIGVRRSDVFIYDPSVADEGIDSSAVRIDWSRQRPAYAT